MVQPAGFQQFATVIFRQAPRGITLTGLDFAHFM